MTNKYELASLNTGERYDADGESNAEISRFEGKADVDNLPDVVRSKGGKQWLTEEESQMDVKKLAATAKKIKRNKLIYSGLSM